jgi:hypothetical protein
MAAFVAAALTAFIATVAFTVTAAFVAATFAFVAVVTAALAVFATRFVLMEAGAAAAVFAVAATGERQRAARAEHEQSGRQECREALLHAESLVL